MARVLPWNRLIEAGGEADVAIAAAAQAVGVDVAAAAIAEAHAAPAGKPACLCGACFSLPSERSSDLVVTSAVLLQRRRDHEGA